MHTKSSNLKQRVNFYTVVKLKGQEEGRVGFELGYFVNNTGMCSTLISPFQKQKFIETKLLRRNMARLDGYQLLNIPTCTGISVLF
jgi:hypothetical protein